MFSLEFVVILKSELLDLRLAMRAGFPTYLRTLVSSDVDILGREEVAYLCKDVLEDINPCDAVEARAAVEAALIHNGPVYMRFGRYALPILHGDDYKFELGKGVLMADGSDVTLVGTGFMVGTCLEARNYDASSNGTYWVNPEYDWGYADNFSPIDRLTNDENTNADINANHFKISNAIDASGVPKKLDYIDFIKVQVGLNSKSGWLGEVSTEVCGFYDYRLKSER